VVTSSRQLAAGALVWREVCGLQLLVVHRARYDDWTFPKGKRDPGEPLPVTAVSEVNEETGVEVRLGAPLPTLEHPLGPGCTKRVSYWCARPVGVGELHHEPDAEIDGVRWVDAGDIASLLTYGTDRRMLDDFRSLAADGGHRTEPLIVLRHAKSQSRRRWRRDDRLRPLTKQGHAEAQRLVPLLTAYGIRRVVSSDSTRCVQTVQPFADAAAVDVVLERGLSQEDATRKRITKRLPGLAPEDTPTLVCTNRPVLRLVWDYLGLDSPTLAPAQFLVVHRCTSTKLATEAHRP